MDQLIRFLKDPYFNGEYRKPSFLDLFLPLVGYFVLVIPIGVLLLVLSGIFNFSMKTFEAQSYQRLLFGLLLGPFVEEIFFRLIYGFNKRNLWIIIVTSLIFAVAFTIKSEPVKAYIFLAFCFTFSLLLIYFTKTSRIFNYYFKFFFYGLAMIFAFLHIFNFSGIEPVKYLLVMFIIIPQFILGLLLGYVRLTYGFIYAVGFHMVVNLSIIF